MLIGHVLLQLGRVFSMCVFALTYLSTATVISRLLIPIMLQGKRLELTGGTNARQSIHIMLKTILPDEVAQHFSLSGRSSEQGKKEGSNSNEPGKKKFAHTVCCSVIYGEFFIIVSISKVKILVPGHNNLLKNK